jgi:phosphohistidine phosphatase
MRGFAVIVQFNPCRHRSDRPFKNVYNESLAERNKDRVVSKQLLIVRHAKSSWSEPDMADHLRPLNKRGKRDASRMAKFLSQQGLVPDIIISSTAERAKLTAQLMAEEFNEFVGKIQLADELYLAKPDAYLKCLYRVPDQFKIAMVVGHNPGLEVLVEDLSAEFHAMPTAAVAHFELDISEWSNLGSDTARLMSVWRPKEIEFA